ncbi:phospholipid phosphatase [Planococcus halotolerans]|uniref:Phospholipid phosphatase n=1 Tax=Planococcus halotolerans TaxID=2233542 RepID=A0A365KR29_9BACL|nr:phospholipid phosphatase [Planococcus halotolerans]QHJ69405.1 phospholipid phosphatase [Planococcus halotolerans]RAZ75612.1 phospholipid phosphatase [Planococcus halotolerans]
MDLILFFILTAAYIGLIVWAVMRQKRWTLMAAVYLVLFGLIYDNGIIALGKFIGEGALLENLNAMRYWIHALLTPALVLFSLGALRAAGVGWARKSWALYSAVVLFILGVVIEIWQVTWGTELAPVREYGVLKYASTEEAGGPPIMILLVSAVLLIAGLIVWKKAGWPWMFVGSVIMGIGSSVTIPVESAAVTNIFELILLASLVWTKIHLEKKSNGTERGPDYE